MNIIAFELSGDYAHFSHPATIYSSLTYPVPPKTAIMGLLGAIIGEMNYFKLNDIGYSVILSSQFRKKTMIFNGIKFALSSSIHIEQGYQDSSEKKQFYKELIKDPRYVIFVDLSALNASYKENIIDSLKAHRCVFTPYLGINFCIADFKYIEIKNCELVHEKESFIDTFVLMDDFIFDAQSFDIRLATARMACGCEEGRIFKDFKDFVIKLSGNSQIKAKNRGNIYQINDYKVYFAK